MTSIVVPPGPPLVVAFDASAVSGAVFSRGLLRARLRAFARVELPRGALVPTPTGPSLPSPGEVADALLALRERLGPGAARATLLLPDGVGRFGLFEAPSGTDLREFVRFRLAPSLPYPPAEAVVDALRVGRGRVLGAAVRRSVVAEYEQAAKAAGFEQERVDLAPLVALTGLLRRGTGVHVILGDAASSLAAFDGPRLAAFRSRRRDPGPGEAGRLREEARRTLRLAGTPDGNGFPLTFLGPGADALVEDIAGTVPAPRVGRAPSLPAGADAAWLSGFLG